jgi:hypothetical protein
MVTYRMIPLLTSHLGKAPVVEDGRDIGVVYDKKRFDELIALILSPIIFSPVSQLSLLLTLHHSFLEKYRSLVFDTLICHQP